VEAKAIEAPAIGESEAKTYVVIITAPGKDLLSNVRVLRKVSGLMVGEVKALLDKLPSEVKRGLSLSAAEAMLTVLTEAGFTAEIKAGGDDAEAPDVDAETTYSVFLTSLGSKKIHVIKIVREYTKLGLKDTKELVESAPVELKAGLTKTEADAMLAELKAVGATAEIK
jgi:large subunit ribosomal protein L7/L12